MKITKDQVQKILQNKPQGTSDLQILTEMTNQGFEFEGVDMNAARQFASSNQTQTPVTTKPTSFTGLEKAPFQATGEENILTGGAKALGNLPRSTFELGKGVVKAVTSPVETVKGLTSIVKGAGAKVGELFLEDTDIGQKLLEKANQQRITSGMPELKRDAKGRLQAEDTPDLQAINQVGKFFADRYGSLDKIKETMIEDPASVLADVSSLLTGGSSILSKAGIQTGRASKLEPIQAITQTTKKAKDIAKETTLGRITSEAIPTGSELKANQVVKALDLTQGDLSNIKKATGNDVTEFIVSRNLIKNTPEEIADVLNDTRKSAMTTVRENVKLVNNTYTPEQIPTLKPSLETILADIKGVTGLESEAGKIEALLNKASYTLDDVQTAKELIDANSSLYSKIGDVKSTKTARGLANNRQSIQKFIEDEVSTATNGEVDIRALNNEVATSYAIENAINTRATRDLTRQKWSMNDSLVLFGGGATFSPEVGIGLLIGKKLIETPSFRLAFTKALSAQPIKKIKAIVKEIKDKNVSPETQKLLNQLADTAKNNLQLIESGTNVLERTKQEPQNKIDQ